MSTTRLSSARRRTARATIARRSSEMASIAEIGGRHGGTQSLQKIFISNQIWLAKPAILGWKKEGSMPDKLRMGVLGLSHDHIWDNLKALSKSADGVLAA